jgi:hypothetical protein
MRVHLGRGDLYALRHLSPYATRPPGSRRSRSSDRGGRAPYLAKRFRTRSSPASDVHPRMHIEDEDCLLTVLVLEVAEVAIRLGRSRAKASQKGIERSSLVDYPA